MMGRHVWKKVDMSGDFWKAEDSVLFFIYIPIITVSFTRQASRIDLSCSLPLSSPYCPSVLYFLFFELKVNTLKTKMRLTRQDI